MKTGFAVIGLGRFGLSVARTLTRAGHSVLAIDSRAEMIQEVSPEVEAAVCADTTDEDVMEELSIQSFRCVIVGIGEASMESSILTTALLSQMGVARIVARATHELHGRVLRAVGAHEVVYPEAEIGERVAMRLAQPGLMEQFSLGKNLTLAEVEAPQQMIGKTFVELGVRTRYDVSVVAIRRDDDVLPNPKADEAVRPGDILIVIGSAIAVKRLTSLV